MQEFNLSGCMSRADKTSKASSNISKICKVNEIEYSNWDKIYIQP
jgi:hypothetical protein